MPAPTSHDVQPHSHSAHHDPAASSTSSNLPHDTINVHQASTLECCGELKGGQTQQIDAIMVATPVRVHNLVSELQHYQRLKLQCSRATLADDDRGDKELRPCASTEQMKHQAQHRPAIHEGNQQQQQGLADAVWASSQCRPIHTSEYDCMALQKLAGESFWLGRALPLLCLINIVLVVNSLSITLSAYFVVAYGGLRTSYRWHDVYASFGPLFGVDVLLALYLGWTVVPQYALASASCGHGFGSLRRKLRAMKGRASGDLGEEIGLSGLFMRGLESARDAVNGLEKSCAFRTNPSSSSGKEESSTSCIPSLHCATLVSQTGSPSGDLASSFECKNRRKEGSHPNAHFFLLCHNKHFPLNMMSEDGKALLEIWLESLWVRAGLQPQERLKRGQAVCRPSISPEVELGDLDHDEDEEVHNHNTFRVRTPKIWSLLQSIFMVLDEEGFGALTIEELACCLCKLCAGTLSMRDAMLMAMQAVHKEQTLFDVAELVTSCAFLFFSKLGAQGEAGNTITQSTLASALSNLGISSNPDNVRAMLLCMHDYPTLLHSGEVHGCTCQVPGEVHSAQQGEDNALSHIVHHESGRSETPAVASASTYHVGNTRAGIESPPVQGGDLDVCPQHPSESRCTRSVFEVAHSDGLTASLAGSTKGHTGYFDQGDRGAGFDTAGKWKAAVCNEGGLCARSATKRQSPSYSVQYSVFSAFMHHEFMQDL
ncbi:hypothetical protein CEUSTIGMA_g11439.t1 [Chlamydomonas eustigma]|uniref:Uncharacterized protein n=1 Tax=Chlamydomonas eustigma TaxID=1157962 RepID=A0A250XLR6_9CHLO|nr:hypothetical protein CEUSTIGMA_g11439.t1 [Chlamydomonas eustigma]|eukprot:GAX84014.1 hypothetical protein CEUSTIGMA_g11439.t1 [Chlamydomonas eustigma]